MLDVFSKLLVFNLLALATLRIFIGFLFARFGWLKLTKDKKDKIIFFEKINLKPAKTFLWIIALLEIIVGLMIMIGLLTQVVAVIASLIMLASIIIKIARKDSLPNSLDFYILFFIVFTFLIFSGAGTFAFDLSF